MLKTLLKKGIAVVAGVALLFGGISIAYGAIAYDNSAITDANDGGGTSPCCGNFSMSYTVGSASNRLLLVAIAGDNVQQSTAVTYAGSSMTLLGTVTSTEGNEWGKMDVWYLLNPTSGSNTLSVSRNGYGRGIVASYSGVKQTGFPDASTGQMGGNNPQVVSTTVVASDAWLVGIGQAVMSTNGFSARTNRTQRKTTGYFSPSTGRLSVAVGDSNGTVTTGAQSFSFDNDSGGNVFSNGGYTISLAPAIDAPATQVSQWNDF